MNSLGSPKNSIAFLATNSQRCFHSLNIIFNNVKFRWTVVIQCFIWRKLYDAEIVVIYIYRIVMSVFPFRVDVYLYGLVGAKTFGQTLLIMWHFKWRSRNNSTLINVEQFERYANPSISNVGWTSHIETCASDDKLTCWSVCSTGKGKDSF